MTSTVLSIFRKPTPPKASEKPGVYTLRELKAESLYQTVKEELEGEVEATRWIVCMDVWEQGSVGARDGRRYVSRNLPLIEDETRRYEVQLYAQLTNEFRPFLREENVTYLVSAPKRDEAFRELLLYEYDYACAVCNMKFRVDDLVEAQAAHIIPKRQNGTDDPRNGLALCRSHHWAFDAGLFTLTQMNEITVSPLAKRAEIRKFELLSLEGKPLREPLREAVLPHPKAIAWHREKVWRGE